MVRHASSFDEEFQRYAAYRSWCMGGFANGPDRAIAAAKKSLSKSVCPTEVFHSRLAADSRFQMLKGTSERGCATNPDGSLREVWVGLPGRTGKSDFWKFNDEETGKFAIACLPKHSDQCCRGHLQILWVDERWGGKGIATRAVRALQDVAQDVDGLAAQNDATHDGKKIQCGMFSLWLAPCCFHTPLWDVGDKFAPGGSNFLTEIDWSNPRKATKDMVDDSSEKLPTKLTRLAWDELRDWYKRLGFVEVDGLSHEEVWDDQYMRIRRIPMMRPRSYGIGRLPMVWPEKNASAYMKEEE